jgi:hypothetical protein
VARAIISLSCDNLGPAWACVLVGVWRGFGG